MLRLVLLLLAISRLAKFGLFHLQAKTITVQAGARVSQVLDALRVSHSTLLHAGLLRKASFVMLLQPYGLTLENFSSVQEQQIGGWTQVAAHGTGASLPTVRLHYLKKQHASNWAVLFGVLFHSHVGRRNDH